MKAYSEKAENYTKDERCLRPTKSGSCVRPMGHSFGCMSQKVLDVKTKNAELKRKVKTDEA